METVIPLYPLMEEAERAVRLGEDTLDLLVDLEWGVDDTCPSCGGHPPTEFPAMAPNVGHMRGCALRAMLDAYLAIYREEEVAA